MKCFVEIITTPTADTPGTVLLLHFDNCRYLVGNLSEGTQRACNERGVGLRKISNILLTGRTEWSNLGGLLGMILELADVKHTAQTAQLQELSRNTSSFTKIARVQNQADILKLDIYGATNLNHLIATSRRFIFRTGMPINAVEFGQQQDERLRSPHHSAPTWEDERIKVWTMVLVPCSALDSQKCSSSPRKRNYDEVNDKPTVELSLEKDPFLETRKAIVSQMFNSTWKLDNLIAQPLSQVSFPAKVFVRDEKTRQLSPYKGPKPGNGVPVPDITVWVREPWPGALTEHLVPPKASSEAISYIVKNHPQRGKFQPEKAIHLGVPKGVLWSRLANGHTVKNEQGVDITPEMVLQPGKQGGGLAIIDMPTPDYIESMIARPEWCNPEIMEGVDLVMWILGRGVGLDVRLKKFQSKMGHLMHIVASPDLCPNILALEAAAMNSLRHNFVDDAIFPVLQCSPIHDHETDPSVTEPPAGIIAAHRGQIITLEPQVKIQMSGVKQPLHLPSLRDKIAEEFQSIGISRTMSDLSLPLSSWIDGSQEFTAYGDTEIVILGTGSSHPSRSRNVSGTLIRVPGCGSYLLDCGEGTLGTLKRMFSPLEVELILRDLKMIWISHLHADHHLGLASIIKAWSQATSPANGNADRNPPSAASALTQSQHQLAVVSEAPLLHWLHEYGPVENLACERILTLETLQVSSSTMNGDDQRTLLRVVGPRTTPDNAEHHQPTAEYLNYLNLRFLDSVYVNHCRGAQAVSLTFKTGLKISYSGDCRPSAPFAAIGRNSHVLIHEATFQDDMRGEALAKKHSTAGEAVIVAHEMKAQTCLLTHFSQRYPEMPKLGTQVRGREGSVPVEGLIHVLEEPDEALPSAIVGTNEGQNVQRQPEDLQISRSSRTISGDIDSDKVMRQETRRSSSNTLELIDEEDIKHLISASGMKIVFAFDYMRLKLKDVPRLQAKEPLLRKMYDEGIGKEAHRDTAEEVHRALPDGAVARTVERKKKKGDEGNQVSTTNEN